MDDSRLKYLYSLVEVLPDLPGVYQYFDKNNTIIYIGKAKSLKNRVSQYFFGSNLNLKTQILVSKICNIKHIVVDSEQDAFLLENNLIKKYKPHYNILLKDDKSYPWIVIRNENFPRVEVTRNLIRDGSLYFGPFTSSFVVKSLLDIFHSLFPIRTCALNLKTESIIRGNFKPCLKFHLMSCIGPCDGNISEDDYGKFINDIKSILKGNISSVISEMKNQMIFHSENLNFEEAQLYKQRIEKLSSYQSKSMVCSSQLTNLDVVSYFNVAEDSSFFVNFIRIVEGSVIRSFTIELTKGVDDDDQMQFSHAFYSLLDIIGRFSKSVIVPFIPNISFNEVTFSVPISGDKKKLLELSEKNAKLFRLEKLNREIAKNSNSKEEKLLLSIKEVLGLPKLPRHVECFDNSNIQGKHAVAACVVFKNCKPSKSDYRLFNIKTVEGPDDYASMYEVVSRRYSRLLSEHSDLPDLIVADGGVGQMHVIKEAIDNLNLDIPIVGLAKDSHHATRDVLYGFPPKVVNLAKVNYIFRFFTRLQDEVHRFAITFHKKQRSKAMTDSQLDHIDGIGPKTIQLLLSNYKSIDNIKSSSFDELSKLIGKSKASILINKLNQ